MDFSGFPYDSHTLEIPVTAYGLSGNALVLSSRNPALSAYSQNVEWILHEDDVSCETTVVTVTNTGTRDLYTVRCYFPVTRDGAASLVTRLITPMCIVSLLAISTLWQQPDIRVSSTMDLFFVVDYDTYIFPSLRLFNCHFFLFFFFVYFIFWSFFIFFSSVFQSSSLYLSRSLSFSWRMLVSLKASAFYYIAGEQVPVLTYLTQLDKYFSSIFAILFFLSIGHVCIGNLIKSDEDSNDDDFETKSRKLILGYIIDVIMRIVTPFLAMFFFIYYALEHWTPATIMVTVFSCVLAVMLMISGVYNGKLHYDAYIQTQKDRSLVFILRLKFYSIYLSLLSLY
mmetsp:Transcript_669/g.853  ORF Transcript_669/g.853 Transcript_669/m.853 type:complete len:340 (+) Transcript_669:193-1212(+)